MKRFGAFILSSLVLVACSGNEHNSHDEQSEETAHHEEAESNSFSVIPNRLLRMEVSGMSCEHACGGAIREKLVSTGAVARVQYDFEMGREKNIAKIQFDKDKITVDEMVALISELNDKQFTVGTTESEEFSMPTESTTETTSSSSSKGDATIHVESSQLEMPNLFDVLSNFIVG